MHDSNKSRKSGFTLIELIVVIAIIGVLCAILVPAIMGYVQRSKITAANSNSKSIYNGLNTGMVELEQFDYDVTLLAGDYKQVQGITVALQRDLDVQSAPHATQDDLLNILYKKVYDYFSDVIYVDQMTFRLSSNGCKGVGVMNGLYPGSHPIAISKEDYAEYSGDWNSDVALGYALEDATVYAPAAGETP